MLLNWSALFLFLVLGLLGLWASYSFMNKTGLYLFSVVALMLSFALPATSFFNNNIIISMSVVLMPLIYFAIIVVSEKYKSCDAKRLAYVLMAIMGVVFVSNFFVAAYVDSQIGAPTCLTWEYLGSTVAMLIAFVVSFFSASAIAKIFPIKEDRKYLRRSIIVSIACAIHTIIYSALTYIGTVSFGNIMLIILISLVIMTGSSFAVAYLRKFLNRQPKMTIEEKEAQKETEEKTNTKDKKEEKIEVEVVEEDCDD